MRDHNGHAAELTPDERRAAYRLVDSVVAGLSAATLSLQEDNDDPLEDLYEEQRRTRREVEEYERAAFEREMVPFRKGRK